jgi:activator of HSP90 ATPase
MKVITQTYAMRAKPSEVFAALTDPQVIQKWSGAPAQMDAKVGTKFALFGGQIHGTNLESVANQKLVQDWTAGDWPKPSTVTFTLVATPEGTNVELQHAGVPDDAQAHISEGWDTNYLGKMRTMFADRA